MWSSLHVSDDLQVARTALTDGFDFRYEQCGCVNPFLWNARSVMVPGSDKIIQAPLCRTDDECYSKASNDLYNSLDLITKYCSDCSEQCSIVDFLVQVSSSVAPVEWQMKFIQAQVENRSIPLPADWSEKWREHIRANYLRINVVHETNVVENNTQSAILDHVDVLSNLGGQSGLWLGISFLSMMEFIEMIYRLIRHQLSLIR